MIGPPMEPKGITYDLKNERVNVVYSDGNCTEGWPYGWNVKTGTVIGITIYPQQRPKLVELPIDISWVKAMNDLSLSSVNAVIRQLGMSMMKTARFEYDRHINNRADGFRRELTQGNQGAGVYGHILGIAGARLVGLAGGIVMAGQMAKDLYDYYRAAPKDRGTNRAELAGNIAGARVGHHMWNFMSGATPRDPQRLKNSLMKELCE